MYIYVRSANKLRYFFSMLQYSLLIGFPYLLKKKLPPGPTNQKPGTQGAVPFLCEVLSNKKRSYSLTVISNPSLVYNAVKAESNY